LSFCFVWFIIDIYSHFEKENGMLDFVKNELKKYNIELVFSLNLEECEIKRPYLLERSGISKGSVIIFAVPYLSKAAFEKRNISAYAVSRDYHIFFDQLFKEIIPILKEKYPNNSFAGFTDHSPINEIVAAAKTGIGVIGKNHLLITEKHSSFVFLGEIITDAILPSSPHKVEGCEGCQKCIDACPVKTDISKCISAVTQKKADLDEIEVDLVKTHGCAWGCDICQLACPHTQKALNNNTLFSSVDFFNTKLTPILTSEGVEQMSDEEFKERAYSWRGKQAIIRNLKILEGKES